MVAAHHQFSAKARREHLRLILGTSMGCCIPSFGSKRRMMHDALACQPVQIAGRNRIWRKMVMDADSYRSEWKGGEYSAEPQQSVAHRAGLSSDCRKRAALYAENAATRTPRTNIWMILSRRALRADAKRCSCNQVNASRNYDPFRTRENHRASHVHHFRGRLH